MKNSRYYILAVLFLVAFVTTFNYGGCWEDSSGSSAHTVPDRDIGSWETVQIIDDFNGVDPHIATDPNGNAIATWYQSDGNIYANRYITGTGWGTSQVIENDSGPAWNPWVAMDTSGNAIAVWAQLSGTDTSIFANRYVTGTGWGTAQLIETTGGDALVPHVEIDSNGNAVAVWPQGSQDLCANRYISGTGWGTAQVIDSGSIPAFDHSVGVDTDGNAITVWYQDNGIWANRYVVGSGWGTAELIETDAPPSQSPHVATDPNGNAIAVWGQSDYTQFNIWASRYVTGTGWSTPVLVETNAGSAYDPYVTVDQSGNAIVVWYQNDGTRTNIWANRYVVGSGWGTAQVIETGSGDAVDPQVVVDMSGNATATWRQSDGTRYNIWANRYLTGTGWGTAVLIENDDGDADTGYPRSAVDSNGNVIVVWQQIITATCRICANWFKCE